MYQCSKISDIKVYLLEYIIQIGEFDSSYHHSILFAFTTLEQRNRKGNARDETFV